MSGEYDETSGRHVPNQLIFKPKDEVGSAILYSIIVGAFVMILAYAMSTFLGRHDKNSRRVMDRTVYRGMGDRTAAEVSDPTTMKAAESTRNDTPYN